MKLPKLLKSLTLSMVFAFASAPVKAQEIPAPTVKNHTQASVTLSKDVTADNIAATNNKYGSIVIHAETGEILSGSQMNKKLHPASTTKLMTAYLVFKALDEGKVTLDQKLPVSVRAQNIETSDMGLIAGQSVKLESALRGMLVKSANDASIVLAAAIGGTEAKFIEMMNDTAKELGMTDTKFVNANGLPYDLKHGPSTKSKSPQSRATPMDMAILMQALVTKYPQYAHYLAEQSFTHNGANIRGHNKIMVPSEKQYDARVTGGKTGFVLYSGCNLVCTAEQNGEKVIAVVFGMPTGITRSAEISRILDNAFEQLEQRRKTYVVPAHPVLDEKLQAMPPFLPAVTTPDIFPANKPKFR